MKYTGKDGSLKTGAGADSVVNLSGFTVEQNAEELDASILDGSNTAATEAGQLSWSANVEALYDPLDAGQVNLEAGVIVELKFYPAGESLTSYIGEGLITSVSDPIEVNGMIRQTVTIKGDDELLISSGIPANAITEVTTGNPLTEVTSGAYITEV